MLKKQTEQAEAELTYLNGIAELIFNLNLVKRLDGFILT